MGDNGASSQGGFGAPTDDPRRRAARHKTEALSCELGRVLDLSIMGMRVAGTGKPPLQVGQSGQIKLRIPEGALAMTGRSVWIRRTGFRKYEMGVEFLNVKRSVKAALDSIARFGFLGMGAESQSSSETEPEAEEIPDVRASVDLPDYYKILGLTSNATDDEIRNAFRTLARKFHPDVSDDPDGLQHFIKVQEAYDFLRDAERRKKYDLQIAS